MGALYLIFRASACRTEIGQSAAGGTSSPLICLFLEDASIHWTSPRLKSGGSRDDQHLEESLTVNASLSGGSPFHYQSSRRRFDLGAPANGMLMKCWIDGGKANSVLGSKYWFWSERHEGTCIVVRYVVVELATTQSPIGSDLQFAMCTCSSNALD